MDEFLVGILKLFTEIIEAIVSLNSTKKAVIISSIILIFAFIIVFILTKDFK